MNKLPTTKVELTVNDEVSSYPMFIIMTGNFAGVNSRVVGYRGDDLQSSVLVVAIF